MTFVFSPWIILATIAYAIIIVIAVAVNTVRNDKTATPSNKSFFFVLVGGVVMFNIITLLISGYSERPHLQAAEAAGALGLTQGQAYPVQVGEKSHRLDGSGSFFFGSGSIKLESGSTVSFSFDAADGRSYIFEVPVQTINFKKVPGADTTASLYFENNGWGMGHIDEVPINTRIMIQSGYLVRDTTYKEIPVLNEATKRRGLAPLVAEYIDSVTMELSPEVYAELLGTP